MTHEELIQKAVEHLKANDFTPERLADAQVREAVVVYFKIRPHANCLLVLDAETGERIASHFGEDALLPEYLDHCQLPKEAKMLAEAVHNGSLDRFAVDATEPSPPAPAELITYLQRRCPGWSQAEYENALTDALARFQDRAA